MALTDHDSTEGLEAARTAAKEFRIALVPGVEISGSWRAQSIHVLGLWIDPANATLSSMLRAQAELRSARMRAICARLDKAGLPGAALLAAVQAQPGVPTRLHLAAAMVAAGSVARTDEAFRKFLGRGKPGHVPIEWPALAQVIGAILDAGGVAVLAHPGRYPLSGGAPAAAHGFRRRRWHRAGDHERRQWRTACRGQHRACGKIWAGRIGRIGFSQPAVRLESARPLP
jgi:predicted metal-dependent phosphoesterase TrpH